MKKFIFGILVIALLLAGCSTPNKSAKELGSGVSVEVETNEPIKQMQVVWIGDGRTGESEFVAYADGSAFKKNEQLTFDVQVGQMGREVQMKVRFAIDDAGEIWHETNAITIKNANDWITTKLNEDLELELIEFQ